MMMRRSRLGLSVLVMVMVVLAVEAFAAFAVADRVESRAASQS